MPPCGGCGQLFVVGVEAVFLKPDNFLSRPFVELQESRFQRHQFVAYKYFCHLLNVAYRTRIFRFAAHELEMSMMRTVKADHETREMVTRENHD